MFKTILVPMDGSRFSRHALPYALDLAKRYKARIVLLRVVELSTPITGIGSPVGLETGVSARVAIEEAMRQDKVHKKQARRYMKRKLAEVTSQGIDAVSHVLSGSPFDGIIKTCKKEKADLIVMTTHGEGGLKRVILGSVADKVIRESRTPVMVIRPARRKR